MMMRLFIMIIYCSIINIYGIPIPKKPPGFVYNNGSIFATVQLEIFIDLLCPDSKQIHPVMKQLTNIYPSEKLRILYHLFPLPYHRNAYSIAQAAITITNALGKDAFTKWMELSYEKQEMFWNRETKMEGQVQITNKLKKMAQLTFPNLKDQEWEHNMSGYGGTFADNELRVLWKYACSRGVTGTPIFFINGVLLDEADSSWTVLQWNDIIFPLINSSKNDASNNKKKPSSPDKKKTIESAKKNIEKLVSCKRSAKICNSLLNNNECCESDEVCIEGEGCIQI